MTEVRCWNFLRYIGATTGGIYTFETYKEGKKNLYMTREADRLKKKKDMLWRKLKPAKSAFDKAKYNHCKNTLRSLTRKLQN